MRDKRPVTTYIIIVACIVMWIVQKQQLNRGNDLILKYAMCTGAIQSGNIVRVFSSVFLHADIEHLLFNMLSLWAVGSRLERIIGKVEYIGACLFSIIGAGIMINYFGGNNVAHIGASGMIFGLYVVDIWHDVKSRNDTVPFGNYLIAIGALILISFQKGVSWQGHIGGALGGLLFAIIFIRHCNNDIMTFKQWKKQHPMCDDRFYSNFKK